MDSQYDAALGISLDSPLLPPATDPSLLGLGGHSRASSLSSRVAPEPALLGVGQARGDDAWSGVDSSTIRPRSSSSRSLAHAHPFGATSGDHTAPNVPAFVNPWGTSTMAPVETQPTVEPVRLTQFYPTPPVVNQHTSRNTRPYTAMSALHYNAMTAFHPGGAFLPDGDAADPLPMLQQHQQSIRSSTSYGAVGPSQIPYRDRMYSVPDMAAFFGGGTLFGSDDDVFAHAPPPRPSDYPGPAPLPLSSPLHAHATQPQPRPLPIRYAPTPATASNAHPPPFGHGGQMISPQHISPSAYAPPAFVQFQNQNQNQNAEASGSRPGTAHRPDTAGSTWSMASEATVRPRTRGGEADDDDAASPRDEGDPPPRKKRPRRAFHEIERMYTCNYPGCTKAYGTLNHLNAHATHQKHGPKRLPSEFKEIRKEWRAKKKQADQAAHGSMIRETGPRDTAPSSSPVLEASFHSSSSPVASLRMPPDPYGRFPGSTVSFPPSVPPPPPPQPPRQPVRADDPVFSYMPPAYPLPDLGTPADPLDDPAYAWLTGRPDLGPTVPPAMRPQSAGAAVAGLTDYLGPIDGLRKTSTSSSASASFGVRI